MLRILGKGGGCPGGESCPQPESTLRWPDLEAVDDLFPVPEPIRGPLDLGRDELNVGLIVVGRAGMGSHKIPHPAKRLFLYREQFQMDVPPDQRVLNRDRRVHNNNNVAKGRTIAVTYCDSLAIKNRGDGTL